MADRTPAQTSPRTSARRLPYFTFAAFLALTVAIGAASFLYESWTYAHPSADWRAENRRVEAVTAVRVVMLWLVVAHGAFDAVYAATVTRGWRGLVLGLGFLALSGFLALILLLGSAIGPAMIGQREGFPYLAFGTEGKALLQPGGMSAISSR
jgi:hypothetical protein